MAEPVAERGVLVPETLLDFAVRGVRVPLETPTAIIALVKCLRKWEEMRCEGEMRREACEELKR